MRHFGVAYRLIDVASVDASRRYELSVAASEFGIESYSHQPVGWSTPVQVLGFRYRPWRGWLPVEVDASRTFGLFGGMADPAQAKVSEAVERNIGDMLTATVARIADRLFAERCTFWLLGPAFPKVVGRLASLRLAENFTVVWITPNPSPRWFVVFPSRYRLAPGAAEQLDEARRHFAWAGEDLLDSRARDGGRSLVQMLSVREVATIDDRGVSWKPAPWEGKAVELPEPMRLASALLEVRCRNAGSPSITAQTLRATLKLSSAQPERKAARTADGPLDYPWQGDVVTSAELDTASALEPVATDAP